MLQGGADLGFERLPGKKMRHHTKVHATLTNRAHQESRRVYW